MDKLFDVHLDIFEQKMCMHSFDLLVYAFLLVDDFVFGMMESYDVSVVMGLVVVLIVVDVVVVDDS